MSNEHSELGATSAVEAPVTVQRDPVPMRLFGRDHWSTFAYAETCAVDGGGLLDRRRMRCDRRRHPQFSHLPIEVEMLGGHYPTRLSDGSNLSCHDDWDCLDDLEAAGLIEQKGTGLHRVIAVTDLGWRVARQLREYRATCRTSGSAWATFTPTLDEAQSLREGAAVAGKSGPGDSK